MARDLYQTVTDRIVAKLEAGAAPWVQPYASRPGQNIPCNAITNRPYSGINVLLFWDSLARGYARPRFLTYKQAQAKGGFVKKGETGMMLVYASKVNPKKGAKDKKGDPAKPFFLLKTYTVFNVAQCEGLPDDVVNGEYIAPMNQDQRISVADRFINATGAKIVIGPGVPCYIPSQDYIRSPDFADFHGNTEFYATMFHELAHWTGAKGRLDRDLKPRFDRESYAAEELIAELTAAMISAEFGFDVTDNSAAYIQSWIRLLKNDPKAIFTAASAAQKAVDYLRGKALADEAEEVAEAA